MAKKLVKKELVKADSQIAVSEGLVEELRGLIQQTRSVVAQSVNSTLVQMYWHIGNRIRTEILKNERADYGKQIVQSLSAQLTAEFGRGFGRRSLFRMVKFSEFFPKFQIVSALSTQLSWSHFVEVLTQNDPLKRDFYTEMCRVENWSVRTLRSKIGGMLFERTALSKKPAKLAEQELANLRVEDQLTPDLVFRDPYFLDFLELKDCYSEKDLESAILRELQSFILELGSGFAFVGRQYRIVIDGEDYTIDLLFYHRKLKRLIVIELKLGDFKAADKGQMELYLRWLEKHEMQEGEATPLGMILCAGKSNEKVELLQLDQSGIHVATYLTELPPVELLRQKLHDSIERAQKQISSRLTDADSDINGE